MIKSNQIIYCKTEAGILEVVMCNNAILQASFIVENAIDKHVQICDKSFLKDKEIHLSGTDFQKRVWQAACQIPSGRTVTYKELAYKIGQPNASRAVGTALGKNKIVYFIPCHRVLASSGKLGGYNCGIERKKALLEAEKKLKP